MSDEIIFYTNPMSRGRIVRWMLEELGITYETKVLEYGASMKDPAFLAVNPMGKVPTIQHEDNVVTEAAAICVYLADAFPDAGLSPLLTARADYYRWMFYFAGPFEAAVVNRSLGIEIPSDKEGMIGYGNFSLVMDTVEKLLTEQTYIAGERFTAADVYCGSQIGWGLEFKSVEVRPAFEAYWDRIKDRPARLRADELDNALMPQDAS